MNESNFHNYQRTTKAHILKHPHCGAFLDMGLGKTVVSLTATKDLIYDLDITTALVIAPKRVAENVWTAEAKKWAHLQGLRISVIAGNEKQRLAAIREKADIYTISRDNVVWLCCQFGGNMLPYDMLIVDESSSFKNAKSKRFTALKKVQASFSRVLILTGTPAPNGLIDLWPQMFLLDRGERLGRTITAYRERYFNPGKRNGAIVYNYDLTEQGEVKIHDAIGDIVISMKASDYLDLPGVILNDIEVKFPQGVKQKYLDFERDRIMEIFESDGEITALNAAALSNKLLQFANGAVYDEDKTWHEVHTAKLEAVGEILEAMGGKPVLIAWTYKHDFERLSARYKAMKPRTLENQKDIDDWNAGRIPMLLAHPASIGHGLNIQDGGDTIIWFGQTWSLELYEQLNKRLDRQGKTKPTTIHRLLMEGTIDYDVVASLERKDKQQSGLMAAVKARLDKYLGIKN